MCQCVGLKQGMEIIRDGAIEIMRVAIANLEASVIWKAPGHFAMAAYLKDEKRGAYNHESDPVMAARSCYKAQISQPECSHALAWQQHRQISSHN